MVLDFRGFEKDAEKHRCMKSPTHGKVGASGVVKGFLKMPKITQSEANENFQLAYIT